MTNTSTSALAAAHPHVAAALPGVNFAQGAIDTAESILGQLTSGLGKALDPADKSASTTPGQPGFFGLAADVQGAIEKIGEIVSDARKGDVQEAVADGVDVLSMVFAVLDTFKIDLPVVTAIFLGRPDLHAGGSDKPA